MPKKKNKSIKILVLVTAYNVEDFLESVLKRIPNSIKKYNVTIFHSNNLFVLVLMSGEYITFVSGLKYTYWRKKDGKD